MATNFPTSLDTLTNPTSSDSLSSPSHSAQHANVNDAVEALQAKVGADSSAVTSSHDYKIADHASRLTTLEGASGPGLVHISRTTIGTAVSSVTVSDVFSADYDSYKIILQGGTTSGELNLNFTFGSTTTGYYYAYWVVGYNVAFSNATLYSQGLQNHSFIGAGSHTSNGLSATIEVSQPFNSATTSYYMLNTEHLTGAGNIAYVSGWLNNTNSYTGFTLTTSTGTVTGGTIDVYGYRKS